MTLPLMLCALAMTAGGDRPVTLAVDHPELLTIEKNIVSKTNAERTRRGLAPLVVDFSLVRSARNHCSWMARHRRFQHSGANVGENIAMGQRSSTAALRSWMGSTGHRANILNARYRRIGVAAYRTPGGTVFWCQQFRY